MSAKRFAEEWMRVNGGLASAIPPGPSGRWSVVAVHEFDAPGSIGVRGALVESDCARMAEILATYPDGYGCSGHCQRQRVAQCLGAMGRWLAARRVGAKGTVAA